MSKWIPWNKNKHWKQFCPKGHDTFICGRNTQGRCRECDNINNRQRYEPHPRVKKQFCVNGHDTFICGRDLSGTCKDCVNDRNIEYMETHPEEIKIQKHEYYEDNKEELSAKNKEYQEKHREEIKIQRKAYREAHKEEFKLRDQEYYNEHKDEILKRVAKWAKEHPELVLLHSLKQHAQRKLRVPEFGQEGIRRVVKKCPKNKVIDHFIPLQGNLVSGLHVRWNLQYLTPKQNSTKHNNCNLLEVSKWYGKLLEVEGLK